MSDKNLKILKYIKRRIKNFKRYDAPDGNAWYADEFIQVNPDTNEELKAIKFGNSGKLRIRLPQVSMQFPGDHELKAYGITEKSKAMEECLLNKSIKWKIPCQGHPCPTEVRYTEDFDLQAALQACEEGLEYSDKRFEELTKSHGKLSSPTEKLTKKKPSLHFKMRGISRNLTDE